MREKLGINPADGVAIVTGSSSSGGAGDSSSSSRAHARLRQRVKLPKMWLGEEELLHCYPVV
jgi:hypothetical protein